MFRFEVEYRLCQRSTWAYAAVLFGVPFLAMHAADGSSQYLNAPALLVSVSGLPGAIGLIVSAGVFGDAPPATSRRARTPSSTPHRSVKGEYVRGRFLGAVATNAILMLASRSASSCRP